MNKTDIKKMRDYADKYDIPMIVYGDNEHIFYHNTKDHYPLIWDDNNEVLISFQHNNDTYSQHEYPLDVVCIEYEYIQYCKLLTTREAILGIFNDYKSLLDME